jgi:DNA-binding transcriptional LysR family regulator
VTLEVGPSAQLVRGLQDGTLDFIVARLPPGVEGADLELHPARNEVVALVAHRAHPLAGQGPVALADTLPFEWVIQERGSPIRVAVEAAFHARGLPVPPQVTNSSSLLVALAMLAGDAGVIAPLSAEAGGLLCGGPLGSDLVTLPPREPILVSPYFVISHRLRQHTRAADRLMQEVLSRL